MTSEQVGLEDHTVHLILDEVKGAVGRQFEQNAQLNQRAQQLLGFGGLVLGVVLGLTRPAGETDVAVLVSVANVRVLTGKVRYLKLAQGLLAVEVLYLSVLVIVLPYIS